jgi:hypothetical protein
VNALLKLAKSLNVIGLTLAQCAIGFRTMNLQSKKNAMEKLPYNLSEIFTKK